MSGLLGCHRDHRSRRIWPAPVTAGRRELHRRRDSRRNGTYGQWRQREFLVPGRSMNRSVRLPEEEACPGGMKGVRLQHQGHLPWFGEIAVVKALVGLG